MPNIVVIGGNLAGVPTAHYLLRHVLPRVNPANSDIAKYTVTLISPSDHTFFKIGTPRAFFSPDKTMAEKVFASIPEGFSQYKPSEFSFVKGEAVQVDEATKTITVKIGNDAKVTSVQYDLLVIATGTTSPSPLWTLHGDHTISLAASAEIRGLLPKARTILIAGGGPAGVETAGELAYNYPDGKQITILSGSTQLLGRLKHKTAHKTAEKRLAAANVKVVHNIKVNSTTRLPDGKTSVQLSDGSTQIVDVYIDATTGKPNSGFLPASWLDASQRVETDGTTLRATKAPAGVYSIGDVASFSLGSIMDAEWSVPALGYSIWSDLQEKIKGEKGQLPTGLAPLKEKKYKQNTTDATVIPVGPKGGVGVLFGWEIPNFLVWLIKSRTFFMEKASGKAAGVDFVKA